MKELVHTVSTLCNSFGCEINLNELYDKLSILVNNDRHILSITERIDGNKFRVVTRDNYTLSKQKRPLKSQLAITIYVSTEMPELTPVISKKGNVQILGVKSIEDDVIVDILNDIFVPLGYNPLSHFTISMMNFKTSVSPINKYRLCRVLREYIKCRIRYSKKNMLDFIHNDDYSEKRFRQICNSKEPKFYSVRFDTLIDVFEELKVKKNMHNLSILNEVFPGNIINKYYIKSLVKDIMYKLSLRFENIMSHFSLALKNESRCLLHFRFPDDIQRDHLALVYFTGSININSSIKRDYADKIYEWLLEMLPRIN